MLRIINEPTAAAIAYGLDKSKGDMKKERKVSCHPATPTSHHHHTPPNTTPTSNPRTAHPTPISLTHKHTLIDLGSCG